MQEITLLATLTVCRNCTILAYEHFLKRCAGTADSLVCIFSELQYVLENSEAKSVLTTKKYASQMETLASKANIDMHLLENIEASGSTQQASQTLMQLAEAAAHSKEAQVQQSLDEQLVKLRHTENDGSLIVYTSGTTGRPKGDSAFHA